MSALVDLRAVMDAAVNRANITLQKGQADADKVAAKNGERHDGADRLVQVKEHWLNQKAAARDAVADLIDFADSVIDGPDAGCGCSPICRCRSPEAVAIWAEAMQDEARAILARIGGAL